MYSINFKGIFNSADSIQSTTPLSIPSLLSCKMPSPPKPLKPRPSEIATEARRSYIPYITEKFHDRWPAHSYLIQDSSVMKCTALPDFRLRIGIVEGDPVDVALDWAADSGRTIPVINIANEKKPGGDWDQSITLGFEESFCRRSNLARTLANPAPDGHATQHYPIPHLGGIYSPNVVVFRSGPDRYQVWQEFKALPVISVAPVRRPKLDTTGKKYSFEQERELMREKIRTALRIAVYYRHPSICLGAFGCSSYFRNPNREVAQLWKEILFSETSEFRGHFQDVVFAIESDGGSTSSSKSGKKSYKSDIDVFREVFDPAKLFKAAYQ